MMNRSSEQLQDELVKTFKGRKDPSQTIEFESVLKDRIQDQDSGPKTLL
jgi:hypothetical protein